MNARCLYPIAAALVAAACASKPPEPPPKPFAATKWQLTMEIPIPGEQPYVRFGDGRVEGFGGCNKFAARFVQDSVGARAIAIGKLEMNRRLCDPGVQAAETRFLEVFQSASSYMIIVDVLTMSGSGGTVKFIAVPPPGEAAPPATGAPK
jgi:heat shock protein HslJ